MGNRIKIGDKVRVSKRLPSFYRLYNSAVIFEQTYNVFAVEDGLALLDSIPHKYVTAIPLKYLVKVEAEAKEPKFKVGAKVRVCDPNLSCYGFVGNITKIEDGLIFATAGYGIDFTAKESCLEQVQSKEQTEAEEDACIRRMEAVFYEGIKEELEHILHHEKPTFEVTIDNLSMNWSDYAANLAHDITVKLVGVDVRSPKDIGDYAVSVAKAVVEGLKKK